MDMSIEKMLSHVYEIEGLMLVTRRLGEENTPDVITNKIQRKVRELAEMCGVALPVPEPSVGPAMPPEGALDPVKPEIEDIPEPTVGPAMPPEGTLNPVKPEVDDVPEPTVGPAMPPDDIMVPRTADEPVPAEHLPEEDYDADETWQHDNGEEFKEVFALNYYRGVHRG